MKTSILKYRIVLQWCILGLLSAFVLTMLGCNAKPKESESTTMEANTYRQITMEEAVEIMATETDYIILDVRTLEEYHEGHIPGAICIPNETIGSGEIKELSEKDQLILVYCRSGNRSKQASQKLVKLGYTNVVEFGGIRDWTGETVRGEYND